MAEKGVKNFIRIPFARQETSFDSGECSAGLVLPGNSVLHKSPLAGLAPDTDGPGWRDGDRAAKPSTSPVRNSQSSSSPGAWDDPQWMGKLLLEHHLQRSQLYTAPTHCHTQGQCCPPPHTSSTAVSAGLPDRKQTYENSRERIKSKPKITLR